MARAFRPRVFRKYQYNEPRIGRGGLHCWVVTTSGPLTDKTVKYCTQCGCLSTNPTKVCGDPVPGHLYIYRGDEPPLWIGEEKEWKKAKRRHGR